MTILDFFAKSGTKNFKKYDGEIGLEIETETKTHKSYPEGFLVMDRNDRYTAPDLRFWDIHRDGSLRDFGLEFVLKQPLKFHKELPEALAEFQEKTSKVRFIKDSVTTSVHVHLNMLNESFKTFGNFLTLYTLFENLLIRHSGPDRLSNLFCLPICDAEETYKNIINMFKMIDKKAYGNMLYSEGNVKYAALNLAAFASYGSLEVRSFRGETDVKLIQEWVGILYSILEFARKDLTPKDIMLLWKERQGKFLDEVFQSYRKSLYREDELKLIDQNVWYAASGAYAIKDWNRLDELVKPPEFKPKQKELELISTQQFGVRWEFLDSAQQEHVLHILRKDYDRKYFTTTATRPPERLLINEPPRGVTAARNDFQRIVNEATRRETVPNGWIPRPAGEPIARGDTINPAAMVLVDQPLPDDFDMPDFEEANDDD